MLHYLFLLIFVFSPVFMVELRAQAQLIPSSDVVPPTPNMTTSTSSISSSGATSGVTPLPPPASAKIQGFTITARDLVRDIENGSVQLEGDVRIIYQNQYFEADFVTIDLIQKRATLRGRVKVQTPLYQIGGQEIVLDYEAEQGLIYSGYVQSNNIRFQGELIEKINETEFFVADADYTTCSNCPPTWSFQANRIRAELGGYAYLKNTTFKVGLLPVFWLPYLAVPLKSDRQTGLLPPEIGYNRTRGMIFAQSLFYAPNRSEDATLTLKNYAIGGLKPMIEYRYALAQDSFGSVNAAFLRDSVFASDERLNLYRQYGEKNEKLTRWSIKSYNQYALDPSTLARLQVSLVSDLQYPKDFYDEYKNYSDPALENRFSLSKQFTQSVLTFDSSYYKNLLAADPLQENTDAVHRLPEIRFDSSLLKLGDSPFYFKLESNYTHFYRERKYDDMSVTATGQRYASNNKADPACERKGDPTCVASFDQVYDPATDLIRTGQRAHARLSLTTDTYNIGNFANISPTVSFDETQYFFPVGDSRFNARHYVQMEINSRTKFFRIYDEDAEKTKVKYKHEIIPEIQYSTVPWVQQETHPFFGNLSISDDPNSSRDQIISDNDLTTATQRGFQYDFDDRVYDRNVISFSVLNNIIKKNEIDNTYKTIATLRVAQKYDMYQAQYTNQPLSTLSATLGVNLDQLSSSAEVVYSPYQSATNSTTSVSYLNEKQQYFRIGYTSSRIAKTQDDISLALGFVSPYVNVLTGVVFDVTGDRDNSGRNQRLKRTSLITQLKPPGECWAVNLFYDQKETGDDEWRFRFDFSWDGKPPKVIPPVELNIQ